MAQTLLQGNNLYCERDRRMLFEHLAVKVCTGEVLQVEGPNGSGKTTLLRILAGLSDAYEGELLWQGKALNKVRESYFHNMHYLGHSAGIKQALTAEENLRWYSVIRGSQGDNDSKSSGHQNRVEAVLAKMGLQGFEDVPCYTLSAGQQRRVNLARLLLSPASLWLLDEPFTAIDKSGIEIIEALIKQHVDQGGAAVVATHQDLRSISPLRKITLAKGLPS